MIDAIQVIRLALYVALALCLVSLYRRTRAGGYLWLLFASVVWPAIDAYSEALRYRLMLRVCGGEHVPTLSRFLDAVGWTPGGFTVRFQELKLLIHVALVLTGFWCLRRTVRRKENS
jgi:hypothetical protein